MKRIEEINKDYKNINSLVSQDLVEARLEATNVLREIDINCMGESVQKKNEALQDVLFEALTNYYFLKSKIL